METTRITYLITILRNSIVIGRDNKFSTLVCEGHARDESVTSRDKCDKLR